MSYDGYMTCYMCQTCGLDSASNDGPYVTCDRIFMEEFTTIWQSRRKSEVSTTLLDRVVADSLHSPSRATIEAGGMEIDDLTIRRQQKEQRRLLANWIADHDTHQMDATRIV